MDKDFDKAIGEERDRFVKAVRDQEWNTQLRTAAENILIMYDQMRDRPSLREQPLREAAEAVMKSWSERMNNEVEEYKENKERGGYWSPSASMVDSSAINQLRTALAGDGCPDSDFTLWVVVNKWQYDHATHKWWNDYIKELYGAPVTHDQLYQLFKQSNK